MKIKQIPAKAISYGGTRPLASVAAIVIHYTGGKGDTAEAEGNYFAHGNTRTAGAHFFVGQDGAIVQSIPMERIAWSVGGARYSNYKSTGGAKYYGTYKNANTVSIELCDNATKDPSDAQVKAVAELIKYIKSKCPNAKALVRHFDITGKSCLPMDSTELLTPSGWKLLSKIKVGDVVCSYLPTFDNLVFDDVLDVVEPYEAKVLKNHHVEATANHRMFLKPNSANSKRFREILWGDVLDGKKIYAIKNGAQLQTPGLDITDDELRFIVWIQGDGHYMKEKNRISGLEFHLKKRRKIERVLFLLDDLGYEPKISECENGSVHIRIYDPAVVKWAETWLDNKKFVYDLLGMNQHQFEIFREEMVHVDGHRSPKDDYYTSAVQQNLDVVQALCATHGVRTAQAKLGKSHNTGVRLATSNYTVGRGGCARVPVETYETMVSCVTVRSGFVLIRQNGRTFIVGNCPARMCNDSAWSAFQKRIGATQSTPKPSSGQSATKPSSVKSDGYLVQITATVLNVREKPNSSSKIKAKIKKGEVYTIVEESNGWGKLKSGAGWIYLKYTKRK